MASDSESVFEEGELLRSNPILNWGFVEARSYQLSIASKALKENTLVVLPTGLGKTIIAALVAAHRLQEFPDGRVVMLAPTKPLAYQHRRSLGVALRLPPDQIVAVTGEDPPEKRVSGWLKRVVVSTPQVLMNDLISGRVDISKVKLMIFDEAHRAVGEYAYTYLAERYVDEPDHLILALTASPGDSREQIREVMRNLHITRVHVRSLKSGDVKPYIVPVKVKWREVELTPEIREAINILQRYVRGKVKAPAGSDGDAELSLKSILRIGEELRRRASTTSEKAEVANLYSAVHAMKVLELLETQGPEAAVKYMDQLSRRRAASARIFLGDEDVKTLSKNLKRLLDMGMGHPKEEALIEALEEALRLSSRRIIVFTSYRVTASRLVKVINDRFKGSASAVRLIGQEAREGDPGLSQREQNLILDDFKEGTYNILVATQIGEEGLDIAECDTVIFYDSVPSAVRYIQRRGRTGRRSPGTVEVLIAKGTRDESYYWIAKRREARIEEALKGMEGFDSGSDQPSLDRFLRSETGSREIKGSVKVIADHREANSRVVAELSRLGVDVELASLPHGDYILSERVAVERKTVNDFASSIIDGRLFEQASTLKREFERPLIIMEGINPPARDVRPEALIGALGSLLVDYGLPVVWTRDSSETALLLASIARREQVEGRKPPRIRCEKKPLSVRELQEYIVAGLPNVDSTLARRLLQRFKTVERVFTASMGELKSVEGIGDKKSKLIRDVLTSIYEDGG
ncbi:MAG: ERCC4 domain-containing protein [Candidatus Bathyarchaeia archaeon]